MKKYVANHHVGLGDYTARPGEIIDQALTEEQVQWLLSIGAIETLPAFYSDAPDLGAGEQEQEEAEPENQDDGQEEEADPENQDDWQEQEDEQTPEIDAMDGITPASVGSAAPKKTRKARGGKTE